MGARWRCPDSDTSQVKLKNITNWFKKNALVLNSLRSLLRKFAECNSDMNSSIGQIMAFHLGYPNSRDAAKWKPDVNTGGTI